VRKSKTDITAARGGTQGSGRCKRDILANKQPGQSGNPGGKLFMVGVGATVITQYQSEQGNPRIIHFTEHQRK